MQCRHRAQTSWSENRQPFQWRQGHSHERRSRLRWQCRTVALASSEGQTSPARPAREQPQGRCRPDSNSRTRGRAARCIHPPFRSRRESSRTGRLSGRSRRSRRRNAARCCSARSPRGSRDSAPRGRGVGRVPGREHSHQRNYRRTIRGRDRGEHSDAPESRRSRGDFRGPAERAARPALSRRLRMEARGQGRATAKFPAILYGGQTIWGLTLRITLDLLAILEA